MIFDISGRQPMRKLVRLAAATACCMAAVGCADPANSPFPSLARINPMGEVLSKEEQEQALKDLEQEQKKQQSKSAQEEVERR